MRPGVTRGSNRRRTPGLAPGVVCASVGLACALTLGCSPVRAVGGEQCRNGLDDDFDGKTDCRDEDCAREYSCAVTEPFDPQLPAWIGEDPAPDLGATFELVCDEAAAEDREIYAVGCQLEPDDCGDGLRCVPLSTGGTVVETACVRRGCAQMLEPCESSDGSDRQTIADACGSSTLCLPGVPACADGPCCVPLCEIGIAPSLGACNDCRPLAWWYGDAAWKLPGMAGVGVCADLI